MKTTGQGDVQNLTAVVSRAVSGSPFEAGLATVAVIGSTAGVTTIEFDTQAREREVVVQLLG